MVTIVKAGEGLGGTVAANLAAQHPRDFDHLVSFFLCENYYYDIGTGESQIDYNTIAGYVKSNPMQRRAIEKSPIFSKKFSDSKFQTLWLLEENWKEVWEMFERCLRDIWEMFARCLRDVWEMFERCERCLRDMQQLIATKVVETIWLQSFQLGILARDQIKLRKW